MATDERVRLLEGAPPEHACHSRGMSLSGHQRSSIADYWRRTLLWAAIALGVLTALMSAIQLISAAAFGSFNYVLVLCWWAAVACAVMAYRAVPAARDVGSPVSSSRQVLWAVATLVCMVAPLGFFALGIGVDRG